MAGKITASKYKEIKTWIGENCNSPADDKKAMAKFGYGQSTIRSIRNSEDYEDYKLKQGREKATIYYTPGDKVWVKSGEEWYKGKIVFKAEEDSWLVRFKGWNDYFGYGSATMAGEKELQPRDGHRWLV